MLSRPVHRLLGVVVLSTLARAQDPDSGAVAFRQACLDATTDALVLNIAAHPDDEADRTLTWLRHKLGVRTVTLYTTCGRGGQNAIGREIGPELARIRVRETLAAAAHTGVAVRWLGFPDFGYSKTLRETLAIWGEGELLARMAANVSALDPDVVLTNHGVDRGHGHHRASAFAIREVLERRQRGGDATVLYQRTFGGRGVSDWQCDAFEQDPIRGTTFARQASAGRRQHRSQGPWSRHDPLRTSIDRWTLVFPAGDAADQDLEHHLRSVLHDPAFAGTWRDGGGDLATLEREFVAFGGDRAVAAHVAAAQRLLPPLRAARTRLLDEPAGRRAVQRLDRRLDALQRIVLAGRGVHVEAFLSESRLLRGGRGTLHALVHAAQPDDVAELTVACRGSSVVAVAPDGRGRQMATLAFDVRGDVGSAGAMGFEPEWVDVDVHFELDGLPITVHRRLAAQLEPALELRWGRRSAYVPQGREIDRILPLEVRYHGAGEVGGPVQFELPEGVAAVAIPPAIALSPAHPAADVLVRIHAGPALPAGRASLTARLGAASASLELVAAEVALSPGVSVALVRGPDDTLQRALEDLRVPLEVLDETALAVADLGRFTTLVLDIRAYHHRPDLADHRDRLLEFCDGGGRIVSFYHKPREWNDASGHPLLAPLALRIGNRRVSEEDAAVTLLYPETRLWNYPQSITTADFAGWVQERALNLPGERDAAWRPLIRMSDDGEPPLDGALLHARWGDGDFVYCSLALYRQLRIGHVGALRILANLLSR